MNTNDVIELLWKHKGRGTNKELAERLGVSQPYLSDVFQGKRGIGEKLAKALGLVQAFEYAKPKRKATK